ncbi:hypothetical protein D3C85_111420 [compost metagenome]
MPDKTANRNALSKFKSIKNSKPTKVTIPNKATNVPIQKFVAGFAFRKKKEPTPTQTGDKLVNNEA